MADTNNNITTVSDSEFVGLLAQYDDPHSLVEACDQARRAGYKKMDAFSPFPVHGIDPALGIKRTKLPLIVFCVGILALGLGVGLQFYTNGYTQDSPLFPGYPFKISGKPMYSLPANIPVIFEVIVLLSAFTAFFGMWALNGLPKLANPLFRHPDFRRATSDGFFLFIEEGDGSFQRERTREELQGWGASAVDAIHNPNEQLLVPNYMKLSGLIVAGLLLVPPVMIYRAQFTKNPLPRLHVNPDMDRQHRGETQDAAPVVGGEPLFADNRVMRKDPAGTIARGELAKLEDSVFYAGVKPGSPQRSAMAFVSMRQDSAEDATPPVGDVELDWVEDFPPQIKRVLSSDDAEEFYQRGKQRYDIYCSVCHGYAGYGKGHVSTRGMALNLQQKAEWIQAKSLFDTKVQGQPIGRIFDTITNGRGGMGPYRSQIVARDRWAIIFYIKAMHLSHQGDESDVPEDTRLQSWSQVNPNAGAASATDGEDVQPNSEMATGDQPDETKDEDGSSKNEPTTPTPDESGK